MGLGLVRETKRDMDIDTYASNKKHDLAVFIQLR